MKELLPALFHTDEPYLSIRRTCCAGVDSVTDCDYNNYIENPKNVLRKVQSAFCPLLALFQVNYQNILKNTCRNEPGKRLNKPVPERQGRNEYRPIKGIDTGLDKPQCESCAYQSRNEYRPIKGIDTMLISACRPNLLFRRNEYRPIKGIDTYIDNACRRKDSGSRNEYRPIKGIDTLGSVSAGSTVLSVEMRIARLRALTHSCFSPEIYSRDFVEMSIARLRALTLN